METPNTQCIVVDDDVTPEKTEVKFEYPFAVGTLERMNVVLEAAQNVSHQMLDFASLGFAWETDLDMSKSYTPKIKQLATRANPVVIMTTNEFNRLSTKKWLNDNIIEFIRLL